MAGGYKAAMEAVIFCGIQASGKTAYYRERFVVDNTNPTLADRRPYIEHARETGFSVVGYTFVAKPREAVAREMPVDRELSGCRSPAILGTQKRLEILTTAEGFDELYVVRLTPGGAFEAGMDVAHQTEQPKGAFRNGRM